MMLSKISNIILHFSKSCFHVPLYWPLLCYTVFNILYFKTMILQLYLLQAEVLIRVTDNITLH